MTNTTTEDTLLTRIAALLRQAESTDNEHEAEVFTSKAQELATLAQIDLATARNFIPSHERREQPVVERLSLGKRGTMGLHTFVTLYDCIAKANDVIGTYPSSSHFVQAYGMPSDIATVNALYASLVVQMVEASNAYMRRGEYKAEKIYRKIRRTGEWGSYEDWDYAPVSGRTARISFQESYAYRVGQRLGEARHAAIAEREAQAQADAIKAQEGMSPYFNDNPQPSSSSVALVLKAKSNEVKEFFSSRHTSKGSYKGGSSDNRSASASAAGRSAANNARLSAPKALGGSRGSLNA